MRFWVWLRDCIILSLYLFFLWNWVKLYYCFYPSVVSEHQGGLDWELELLCCPEKEEQPIPCPDLPNQRSDQNSLLKPSRRRARRDEKAHIFCVKIGVETCSHAPVKVLRNFFNFLAGFQLFKGWRSSLEKGAERSLYFLHSRTFVQKFSKVTVWS